MPRSYYPATTLKEALKIPRTLYEKGAGKPMNRVTLADELGVAAESTPFRHMVVASRAYGLTEGGKRAEQISLKALGEGIVLGDVDKVFQALFNIDVMQTFHQRYSTGGGKPLPSDNVIADFLKKDFSIPDRQIATVRSNLKNDAKTWGLIQDKAKSIRVVPVDIAKNVAKKTLIDFLGSIPESPKPPAPPAEEESQTGKQDTGGVGISPKIQLNIEIHIAADTPDEKIELLFKNMKKYLIDNS